jgi:uncharacterized protein (DUF302 family)
MEKNMKEQKMKEQKMINEINILKQTIKENNHHYNVVMALTGRRDELEEQAASLMTSHSHMEALKKAKKKGRLNRQLFEAGMLIYNVVRL